MATEVETPVPLPTVQLVETDGIPLESHWHVLQISLLIDLLAYWFRDRNDYYAGGNMFIYFSEEQARNRDYRGPDFFYVDGVNRLPMRPYWAVWQEGGRYPDVIVELLSPTTAVEDRTTKKALYERTFKTHEYFCYDPDTQHLEGWRLGGRRRYRSIRLDERGWMWIEELELWLGTWKGVYQGYEAVWLRFYDAQGRLVPIHGEAAEDRAQAAEDRAHAAEDRAQAAEDRAQVAEAEMARLKERLAQLEKTQNPDPGIQE
jgi:Uma2 family endonuclease